MTRIFRFFSGPVLSLVVLTGCQQSPSLIERDGYYTWVDEQGQVRTARVPASRSESAIGAKSPRGPVPEPARAPSGEAATAPDGPSKTAGETGEPADDEYNLANYPDADALEAAGYIRPGDPLPYFTWRDANGQLQVSYYRPDTRSDVVKGLVPEPVTLTPARIYQASEPLPGAGTTDAESLAAPEAFAVLGIESSGPGVFQRWQQDCCRSMPLDDVVSWSSTREFEVLVPDGTPEYRFVSGASPYRLVRLPDGEGSASLVVRLRSFNNEGLFVPSVAFLDETLEPVRLVTDLVMEYTPESWHRQGYLQAMLPAFPGLGERWMLIYTTEADLKGQTVVETGQGPRAIAHQRQGLLSLTEMEL